VVRRERGRIDRQRFAVAGELVEHRGVEQPVDVAVALPFRCDLASTRITVQHTSRRAGHRVAALGASILQPAAGHVPVGGEWLALPLCQLAGSTRVVTRDSQRDMRTSIRNTNHRSTVHPYSDTRQYIAML
jgi:hypothetical protein